MNIPWLRRVALSDHLPRGWRIAYLDPADMKLVCAPIPLHLVARFCRRVWEASFVYEMSDFEQYVSTCLDVRMRILAGELQLRQVPEGWRDILRKQRLYEG